MPSAAVSTLLIETEISSAVELTPVADQHVVSDAFEIDDVFNTRRRVGRLRNRNTKEQGRKHAAPEQGRRHRFGDRKRWSVSVQSGE